MYQLKIEKAVINTLEKINEPFYSKIKTAILKLSNNPRPNGYKKLRGRNGYCIRVGNYRIIYEIFDDFLIIEVIDLGHRKDIYE